MALKRINLNLDEELLKQLEDYAEKMHVNRSSALSFLLSQKFQSDKMIENMPDMLQVARQAIEFEKAKITNTVLLEDGDDGEA